MNVCRWCHKEYAEPVTNERGTVTSCPHCEGSYPEGFEAVTSKEPRKGSKDWYKGKWFRKNDKSWQEDIRSRKTLPNGSIGRFNDRGERIA